MKKSDVLEYLQDKINNNQIFHSILFYGDSIEDFREEVYNFSYNLIREDYARSNSSKVDEEISKNTEEIIAQTKAGIIQDYKTIDSREAKVKDIREMFENVQEKPFLLSRKIFIIENFEFLNHNSQNALLKILEEPPSFVNILITSRSLNGILDTIKSRCEKIYISGGSNDSLDNKLIEKFEDFSDFIYDAETLKKVMFYHKYNNLIIKYKDSFKNLLEYLELKIGEDIFNHAKYIEPIVEAKRKSKANNNFEMTKDKLIFCCWELANNEEKRK